VAPKRSRQEEELDELELLTRSLAAGSKKKVGVEEDDELEIEDTELDDDDVVIDELIVTDEGEVSTAKKTRAGAGSETEEAEILVEDDEPYSVVDIVLAEIIKEETPEDEEEEEVQPKAAVKVETDEEDEYDEELSVIEKKSDEFTCQSCYFILKRHLMAQNGICRDCA